MGGGKVKWQLSLRLVGTLVVRQRMRKARAAQSGRALPMGRCASPPWFQSLTKKKNKKKGGGALFLSFI